ncbi:MAG: type II secretion system F family protein [Candidatus Pacearchaeota archaeon]|nr:MAG: type II secretion system F family protein [Candidatus Pacearchaeota archaeon]
MPKKIQVIAIITSILIVVLSLIFLKSLFYFLLGIAIVIAVLPFLISFITETGREKEKEEMFLEFARNLVESVRVGAPISRSIINVASKDYSSLTPHIQKLANQIKIAIPVKQALRTFASDIKNKVISRSVELIIEAETSGGEIGSVLDAVVKSVNEIEDLKKERMARVYSMVVQGYIIFFIFVVIMLFVELKFMPLIAGALTGTEIQTTGLGISVGGGISTEIIERSFFILLLVQALFAGLVIGKLSQGSIHYGIKHSAILLIFTYLVVTAARALLT